MIDQALLITSDQIVANLRQRHCLPIGRRTSDHEGSQHRAADQPDRVGILLGEGLIDNGLHDPGHEGRGGCDQNQANGRKYVGLDVVAAILTDDPADHHRQRFHILFDVTAARQFSSSCQALREDRPLKSGRSVLLCPSRLYSGLRSVCLCFPTPTFGRNAETDRGAGIGRKA